MSLILAVDGVFVYVCLLFAYNADGNGTQSKLCDDVMLSTNHNSFLEMYHLMVEKTSLFYRWFYALRISLLFFRKRKERG